MELNNIKTKDISWGEAASTLNENFDKINADIEKVKSATIKNKGYFPSIDALRTAFPSAYIGDIAYVGTAYPFQTWSWNGSEWEKKNDEGGEESVNLGDYYTKVETDEKFTEADAKLSELDSELNVPFSVVDLTESVADSFVQGKYPYYSNGSMATAGSTNTIGYYVIPSSILTECFSLRAYLQCNGATPAAFAFYNSDETFDNSTYIGGVRHENTTGAWFEVNVPQDAKTCLVCNRQYGKVEHKIFALKSDKFVGYVKQIEQQLKPSEYKEELLGTSTIKSGATTSSLSINCSTNDVVKIVIDENCKRVVVGTKNYGKDISCGLKSGIYYVKLRKDVSKIYFYRDSGTIDNDGQIQVYKCSSKDLFEFNYLIDSFYKQKNAGLLDKSKWVLNKQWNINTGGLHTIASDATTGLLQAYRPRVKITLTDTTLYKFFIIMYSSISPKEPLGEDGSSTGWITEYDDILPCCSFTITLRKNSGGNITQEDLDAISVEFVEPYVEYYATSSEVESAVNKKADELMKSLNPIGSVNNILNVTKPYYYHFKPNDFIRDGSGKKAIPSQTLFDIEIAARLGFTSIEANIQETSDGNFVCMHGDGGKFGSTVYTLDGTDISGVAISDKSLSWIKENVRFKSDYDKYKVSPPSLEEFCSTCKINGIGIFAGTDNEDAINKCVRILGTDNVMLYGAKANKRSIFNGVMFTWVNSATTTVDKILDTARSFGIPYMYGLGSTLLSTLVGNNQLEDLCSKMHAEGFTVASTAVYDSEENVLNAFEQGVDFSASGHQVNPFEANYKVYDLNNEDDFEGTATIADGVAELFAGSKISCGGSEVITLGKGMLAIKFDGELKINFGSTGNRTFASDGSKGVVLTDYYFKHSANLTIEAVSNTRITSMVYKLSKC